ncbi:alpha/beta hydrolase family protein [Lentilitoribacter sp. EG35]|uniref:alpha/beta hydrolase family protein n=1 Tax=Lentilitoribacter sp. EG35 TaxID=3234192 RepID=UPI003460BA53
MNKISNIILLLVLSWFAISSVRADENLVSSREISFKIGAQSLVGTLVLPTNIKKPPIVLILSGMSGLRNGPPIRGMNSAVFEVLSHTWAMKGIASLRVSTRGRGGSEGDFRNMTLERRTDEALEAVDWIVAQDTFDASSISVLGHSQGALIAASVAKRNDICPLKSVILWAPQIDALRTYRRAMGDTIFQQGLSAKPREVVKWRSASGKVRAFRSDFYKTLSNFHAGEDLKNFPGRVLIVTGQRDHTSPTGSAKVFNSFVRNLTFMEFDVGHRMGASLGLQEFNEVSEATLNWLDTNH